MAPISVDGSEAQITNLQKKPLKRIEISILIRKKKESKTRQERPKRVSADKNKAGYTATLVACGKARAVPEKVTGAFGQSSKMAKNYQPTNRRTDGPT